MNFKARFGGLLPIPAAVAQGYFCKMIARIVKVTAIIATHTLIVSCPIWKSHFAVVLIIR
ncbi:hypothetical protein ACVIGA_005104 [Bradyrhizobium sp. USDA 3240]|uniref:hypothetical protein n=1 Tax=Bradyrhizobium sp. 26S5 TaxID=3139729 RepID=UPI0030D51EB1